MKKPTTRIATRGIADELRDMNVGDVVKFPNELYKYNSIRATPSTTLVPERMAGKSWKTRINYDDKCVEVIRTA